jgi:hypothetical protein
VEIDTTNSIESESLIKPRAKRVYDYTYIIGEHYISVHTRKLTFFFTLGQHNQLKRGEMPDRRERESKSLSRLVATGGEI